MSKYRAPGVYIEEVSLRPPSVAQVETAIPAFIGYTQKGPDEPTRIESMADYRNIYGGASFDIKKIKVKADGDIEMPKIPVSPTYRLYYMLEMFFANGGEECYIISVGNYDDSISTADIEKGLKLLETQNIPTLILLPDAYKDPFELYKKALAQCAAKNNRFLICDVKQSDSENNPVSESAAEFRDGIGSSNLMFGAAYYPNLKTTLRYPYREDEIEVTVENNRDIKLFRHADETVKDHENKKKESLYHAENGKYRDNYEKIKKKIDSVRLLLPPSGAIAGVYARVDRQRGVWKAPANVSLNRVSAPEIKIDDRQQRDLNVNPSGKSINAIRSFKGKGVLVWGARTLAGNDNEWRYIPVRRFFGMVKDSAKQATEHFVKEPNNTDTWMKVKAMLENYLTTLWKSGALMGTNPDEAFFVKVGLGESMTAEQVQQGYMIVEIGMAAVRPAEYIILRFSHRMIES